MRQGADEEYRPEVYVVPRENVDLSAVRDAVTRRLEMISGAYPGVGIEDVNASLRLVIPDALRTGHEAHFAQVTRQFLSYLDDPRRLPRWEKANMLSKYHVTTHGVRLARAAD